MLIRAVSAGRGLQWLSEGFAFFRANPLIWIVNTMLLLVILSLLSLIPLFGSIAATLLQPVFAAGLLKACRDLDRGGELRIDHLFDGFREKTKPLLIVGLVLGLAWIGPFVIWVAATIGSGLFGSALVEAADWGVGSTSLAPETAMLSMLLGLSAILLLSVPLAMAGWFAPALVMFRDIGAGAALKASFVGCLRNMWPFIAYSVLLLFLIILALIPFGLGLLVLAPVLLGSVYAGYKDVYPDGP